MTDPLRKPEGLSWDPASVELPEIPMLPAGQDALSSTISAVLPALAAPLAANVATLQAKELTFAGKLGAAQAAYQNSDDAGSQSVGQVVGMLGQMGQMPSASAQMLGQLVPAAQGGSGSAGTLTPSPAGAAGAPKAPPRDNPVDANNEHPQREEREPLHRADTNDRAEHGQAPVRSPEHQSHRGEQDFGRRA